MRQQFFTVLALMAASMVSAGCQIVPENEPPANSAGPVDPDGPATSGPTASPDPDMAACAPGVLTRLVGQPENVLEVVDLQENTRVLRPGMAATTDHRPDRINIEIDADGIIARVWCG